MTTPEGRKCKNFRCDVMVDTAKEYCSSKCEDYYTKLRSGEITESYEWNEEKKSREFIVWDNLP